MSLTAVIAETKFKDSKGRTMIRAKLQGHRLGFTYPSGKKKDGGYLSITDKYFRLISDSLTERIPPPGTPITYSLNKLREYAKGRGISEIEEISDHPGSDELIPEDSAPFELMDSGGIPFQQSEPEPKKSARHPVLDEPSIADLMSDTKHPWKKEDN